MKAILLGLALSILSATCAGADDVEKAFAALRAGQCDKGLHALENIAAGGSSEAEFKIGYAYHNGICVKKDESRAFKWFLAAAEKGHPDGQDAVGFLYANGIGVKRDFRQSVIWSAAAADQGNTHAKSNLAAAAYELGWAHLGGTWGYPQDLFLAYVWFSIAGENGYTDAADMISATSFGPDAGKIASGGADFIRKCKESGYRECD